MAERFEIKRTSEEIASVFDAIKAQFESLKKGPTDSAMGEVVGFGLDATFAGILMEARLRERIEVLRFLQGEENEISSLISVMNYMKTKESASVGKEEG